MFLENLKNQLHHNQSLFIGEETAFRSAILIPLIQVGEEWHILFEVRSFKMRRQPGDISFPGGRIDATDDSPLAAALRETYEELGVLPNKVNVIGGLSPYVASPTFVVYPFVAAVDYKEIIQCYNKEEVEEVFTIPVKWLLNYKPDMHLVTVELKPSLDFPFDKIVNGTNYQWGTRSVEEWFYYYDKYTIWGLTARILKHFIHILKMDK
ncbi:NUDIX hydrolase [Sutcliffiella cohnii]